MVFELWDYFWCIIRFSVSWLDDDGGDDDDVGWDSWDLFFCV